MAADLWNAASHGDATALRQALLRDGDLKLDQEYQRRIVRLLQEACTNGHVEVVRVLISEAKNVDVHATDRQGRSALFYATNGRGEDTTIMKILQLLLDAGVDPKKLATTGRPYAVGITALHYAKTVAVAQLLLDAGSDVRAQGQHRETPLHFACRSGRTGVVHVLLTAPGGAELVHWQDYVGQTPLHLAVSRNDSIHLIRLLHSYNADANARDHYDHTPMHFALLRNVASVEVVRFLADEMAADLDARNSEGESPLHLASSVEKMHLLLERGVDVEARCNYGDTPLMQWAAKNRLGLVQELTTAGADVTAVHSRHGYTPFDNAWRAFRGNGQVEAAGGVIHHLLQHYRNIVLGADGRLSLHSILQTATYSYASRESDRSFHPPLQNLRMKLPLGNIWMPHVLALFQMFDINNMIRARDESGSVPLHIACQNGAPVDILRMLFYLDEVASAVDGGERLVMPPQIRDHGGALPIHTLLTTNPSVSAVTIMLQAHPNSASMRTFDARYPLMIACESSASVDVIFELLKAHPDLIGRR